MPKLYRNGAGFTLALADHIVFAPTDTDPRPHAELSQAAGDLIIAKFPGQYVWGGGAAGHAASEPAEVETAPVETAPAEKKKPGRKAKAKEA